MPSVPNASPDAPAISAPPVFQETVFRSSGRYGEIHRPHRVRRRPALAGCRGVDDAVDPDQRRRFRVGRKERHRRLHVGAVADIKRVDVAVAADGEQRIDAAEANRRGTATAATPLRSGRLHRGRRRRGLWRRLAQDRRAFSRFAHGASISNPAAAHPRRHHQPGGAGASTVRRLGIAIRPPGQSSELGGWPPVAAV